MQILFQLLVQTANGDTAPTWTPGNEFEKLRQLRADLMHFAPRAHPATLGRWNGVKPGEQLAPSLPG